MVEKIDKKVTDKLRDIKNIILLELYLKDLKFELTALNKIKGFDLVKDLVISEIEWIKDYIRENS